MLCIDLGYVKINVDAVIENFAQGRLENRLMSVIVINQMQAKTLFLFYKIHFVIKSTNPLLCEVSDHRAGGLKPLKCIFS